MRVLVLLASVVMSTTWLACSGDSATSPPGNGGSAGSSGSSLGGSAGSNNGGSNNGGNPGSGGRAGSTGSGGSTVVVDAGSIDASRQACVDRINALRATLSLPPLQRWTANETCADAQAKSDSETGTAHGAFSSCPNMAQNECPNYKSIQATLTTCIDAMWAEGPGTDYNAHGHYINMTNTKYTMVTCGFYTTPTGRVWQVQDFK